jgi:hypothetical protein
MQTSLNPDSGDVVAAKTLSTAITEQNQVNSASLRLPGEIRNAIYHHVLGGCKLYALFGGFGSTKAIFFGRPASSDTPLWLEPISKFLELQLLVVCRQLRAETIPFKFKSTALALCDPNSSQILWTT